MDMQRTGSRPIGVIIAVVVIALCAYGAIQLASNQPEKTTPTNNPPVVVEPAPGPTASPTPNNSSKGSNGESGSRSAEPEESATPDQSDSPVATTTNPTDNKRVSSNDTRDEVGQARDLPSTGPAVLEVVPLAMLIVALSAYRKSRRQLLISLER
jgi:cytoskeletal protein RodZ